MIGFKANRIREVPARALPRQLRWLILTDNDIERRPLFDEIAANVASLDRHVREGVKP